MKIISDPCFLRFCFFVDDLEGSMRASLLTVNKVLVLSCEPERHRQPNSNYYRVVMDLMRRAGCGDGRPLVWKYGAGGILTNHFTLGPALGTAWDTSLSCQEGTQ